MELKIFIDRLKDGHIEKFSFQAPSAFLDLNEKDLTCSGLIEIQGEAYIATDHLILKLELSTTISMPCSICNEQTEIKLHVPDFYHAEPLHEIKGAVFDYTECLREDILIQIPQFTECHGGKCPERENIKNFLKKETSSTSSSASSTVHFPFSDL
jgi:uncharacterized metal-binding protein YceD (DUF177 family)